MDGRTSNAALAALCTVTRSKNEALYSEMQATILTDR